MKHARRASHPMVFAALSAILLSACSSGGGGGGTSTPASGTPRQGGDLVIARQADNTTLDPTAMADNESIWSVEQMYETLYTVTKDGKDVTPWLATSYDLSSDQMTYTFHLRDGVKFSTGRPMTSADVKFSIDRARKSTQGFGYIDAAIKSIDATDPSTVVVHTKYPWAPLVADISLFVNGIIPDNFAGMSEKEFFDHPIGTGPFMFESWTRGQTLKMVRNPYYWQEGKPHLDSVAWTNVPDDNTRILQLKGGQAQIIKFPPFSAIDSLSKTPGIKMELFPSTRTDYILMNEKASPYGDVHVRRAIAYAIDKKALVDAVLFGHGEPANSIFPPTLPFYDPNTPALQFDLGKAKQELSMSSVPNGFDTVFLTDNSVGDSQVAQIIQQELKPLGINVSIKTVDVNQIFALQLKGDYDMSIDYWTMDIPDPDELTEFFLNPKEGGGNSYGTFYDSPKMISLVGQAAREFDTQKRQQLYSEVQALHAQEVPQIPLFYSPYVWPHSDKVQGFFVYPLGNFHLEEVWLSS